MKTKASGTRASDDVAVLDPLLTTDDLARFMRVSRRTIERMLAGGALPRPDLYAGRRCPRWQPGTIRRWIDGQSKS